MKSDSKQSNCLAAISDSIGDRTEMEEWNSVSIGLPVRQNGTSRLSHSDQANQQRQEQEVRTTLKMCGFAGLGKKKGKRVRVWWAGNQGIREKSRVSCRHVVGEEAAEVVEGSRDPRLKA
jgi:hypothetical protein